MEIGSITGLNLYVYCGNDPVNMADPEGCAPKWWQSVLIGVGIIVASALLTTAITFTGGGAIAFFIAAGKTALGGLKIATITGISAGIVRGSKAAVNGESLEDIGKSTLLGFSDGFIVGSFYAGASIILGALSYKVSGLINNGYGLSNGKILGGYQTPKTPGISILTYKGGINGGRSFGLDLDIYNGLHFHTNRFGIGKKSNWIKTHHWEFVPIIIGIKVGLSDGWSEW